MRHCLRLFFRSDTMVWREKERSRIRAVQLNNHIGLLGIRKRTESRMQCGGKKNERMENDMITLREYVEEVHGKSFGGCCIDLVNDL